jgi:hypothetical protein
MTSGPVRLSPIERKSLPYSLGSTKCRLNWFIAKMNAGTSSAGIA